MRSLAILVLFIQFATHTSFAGVIQGTVRDEATNETLPFANVIIEGGEATTTDGDGKFVFEDVAPGLYNVSASFLGYETLKLFEIEVTNSKPADLTFNLVTKTADIGEIEIVSNAFEKPSESPVSLRTIGANEIKRYPGGNRDISKVIQSLPGVASTVSFRNDILIRGGSPSENRFYLDGIEVPVINHFSTQGASGGPVGMLNVDFIRAVDFYTAAFPANRGNALSSVMDIKLLEGRKDRHGFNFTIGASETALSVEGPLGKEKQSSYMLSVRRSYLQFLFKLFDLPFLPTYTDFQYKAKIKLSDKSNLTFIGLGAYDEFDLNLDANETDLQKYILGNLPENGQWNYTVGSKLTLFGDKGYTNIVLSRNHLFNEAFKYFDNDDSDAQNLIFDYESEEIENKFRIERSETQGKWRLQYGLGAELATYKNNSFVQFTTPFGVDTSAYSSTLTLGKYSGFGQLSRKWLNDQLSVSFGLRMDASDYSSEMQNPLDQISPRLAISYTFPSGISLSASSGLYYQLPPYTAMGFRDNTGALINQSNGLKYIRNLHLVGGVDYVTNYNLKVGVEGFVKWYDQYPFTTRDSISLANLGGDFGVVGNEPVVSTGTGRTYGLEFLLQQKLNRGFYGIASYTFYQSEFSDKRGELVPSSWDNQHTLSLTGGKKFKRNWELGVVFKASGGSPYTAYDVSTSALIPVWNVNQQGVLDYDRLNQERLPWFHQMDIRVDKRFYFDKLTFEIYLDIQNLYNSQIVQAPFLDVVRDDSGIPLVDEDDPSRYQTYFLDNTSGQALPSIGLVVSY